MMKRNQNGMAALVVTIILVAFLSAIGVGFAVIMNRETHKSLEAQLAQAAYDAAASGINDSINFLRDNPATQVSQCQDLLGPGKPLNAAADLSGNGNTRYTCVLINTSPTYLSYDSTAADKSQVIKVTTSPTMGKIMVSWQSSNPARRHTFVPVGQAGQLQLFDETTWNASKYAPLMRVSIYPVPADSKDVGFAAANSRTYFLYPQAATGFSVSNMSYKDTASGSLQPVGCGVTNNNGQFNGTADYDCNLIINSLPSDNPAGYIYYLRLTPLYQAADIKIRGNDTTATSQPVQFVNTQAIVDVTAQSGGATKRLQASIDISGLTGGSQNIVPSDDAFPEQALRAANTICKRIQHTGTDEKPDFIKDNYNSYCGLPNLQELKPPIIKDVSYKNVTTTGVDLKGTVNPNNGRPTACAFVFDSGQKYDCLSQLLAQLPTTYSTGNYDVTASPSGLSPDTPYIFKLCASNLAGDTCSETQTFKTLPLPPLPPTVTATGASAIGPTYATLNGFVNANGGNVNDCAFNYGTSSPGIGNRINCNITSFTDSTAVNAIPTNLSPGTLYYYQTCASNQAGSACSSPSSFSTKPLPPPPPPPPPVEPPPSPPPPGGSGNCSDGIQNGDETGIDTGGRCGSGGGDICPGPGPGPGTCPPTPGPTPPITITDFKVAGPWDEGRQGTCLFPSSSLFFSFNSQWYCHYNYNVFNPGPCSFADKGVHKWVQCPNSPPGSLGNTTWKSHSINADWTSKIACIATTQLQYGPYGGGLASGEISPKAWVQFGKPVFTLTCEFPNGGSLTTSTVTASN